MDEAFDPFGIEDAEECPESSFLTTTTTTTSNDNDSQHQSYNKYKRRSNTVNKSSILNKSHDSQQSSSSASLFDFQPQFDASFGSHSAPASKAAPATTDLNRSINSSLDSDIYSHLFQLDGGKEEGDKDASMYGSVGNDSNDSTNEISFTSNHLSPTSSRSRKSPKGILKNGSNPVSIVSSPQSVTATANSKIPIAKNRMTLPVYVKLHETMSCVYDDDSKQSPHFDIIGEVTLITNKFIQGQSFYISLKDPNQQVGTVTTYFDCAKELDLFNLRNEEVADPFVQRMQLEKNCRVFKVDIPENLRLLDMKPIRVMKFNGSEFLRPIPLLVHCKVKVGGNLCRVGVKVRANPTNKKNIKNVAILMAVPPDVSGETMKMSLRGGVWDPMRRIIIWSSPYMKSGETIEFQLQFEYTANSATGGTAPPGTTSNNVGRNGNNNLLPSFPIMVRCDADDKLSDVQIEVGGETYYDANGDVYRQSGTSPYKMNLSTSYRLFHRKT